MIQEFHNISLRDRNSFHVEQCATRLVEFDTEEDLQELFAHHAPEKWMVLGGGNNILFTHDVTQTLLVPRAGEIQIVGEDPESVHIEVAAGVEWDDLVEWAVAHELWGIENLSLIPGKVGAAPVQNIGAYGSEAKDAIESVRMFCPETNNMLVIDAAHCDFGYRESIFKHTLRGRIIITAVRFRLSHTPQPRLGYGDLMREVEARGGATLQHIREAVCAIRRAKLPDPAVQGNAGSFFKNPVVEIAKAEALRERYPDMPSYPVPNRPTCVKLAAGWLIDQAGLKGHIAGKVGVHPHQALVLVNMGGATGGEVIAFAHTVQQRVQEMFGVEIDTEVNIL
ncbi:MAG: UDP-N-acetylmuramate dehydrogenase [Alistipes sp.]